VARLVLIRHGESQWNLENRFTGWIDVALTKTGEAEARKGGEDLREAGVRFDLAFTSVLQRAQRTLAIVLEVLGQEDIPIECDAALNERHYGDLQGLNKAETAGAAAMTSRPPTARASRTRLRGRCPTSKRRSCPRRWPART
jgi:2,3-bisphosphoglycerate-dependent phosphoglycerate mutase